MHTKMFIKRLSGQENLPLCLLTLVSSLEHTWWEERQSHTSYPLMFTRVSNMSTLTYTFIYTHTNQILKHFNLKRQYSIQNFIKIVTIYKPYNNNNKKIHSITFSYRKVREWQIAISDNFVLPEYPLTFTKYK